jgi:hypothetical protein
VSIVELAGSLELEYGCERGVRPCLRLEPEFAEWRTRQPCSTVQLQEAGERMFACSRTHHSGFRAR